MEVDIQVWDQSAKANLAAKTRPNPELIEKT